jgi:hypothetical protein
VCGKAFAAEGTVLVEQNAEDCKRLECDASGVAVAVADPTDTPDDDNDCTVDACDGDAPAFTNKPKDDACGAQLDLFCDGEGKCVGCNDPAQCAGEDDDCKTRTCAAGVCGVDYEADQTPVTAQTDGDCQLAVCDGAGNTVAAIEDGDVPVDQTTCTDDQCSNGVPSNPAVMTGTACMEGMGQVCDGMGTCVECNAPTDCGTDNVCTTYTCTSNVCGVDYAMSGTSPMGTMQTAGDCKKNVCDGMGNTIAQPETMDLPVDNNTCTNDVCMGATPSNPAVQTGTTCNQNNGKVCSSVGTCVACNVAGDCGTSTECVTYGCMGNACTTQFTNANTLVASQTAGDCKKNVCDGAGAQTMANDDADVPGDNKQCTSDVCTNGAPSNPNLQDGTACNESGGSVCNGQGACVAPLSVTGVTPADGATPSAASPIAITFNRAMSAASLTVQTASGACTGSIQVSDDNFTTCLAMNAATATLSNGDLTATVTPAPGLLVNRGYKVRVAAGVLDTFGLALPNTFVQANGFVTQSPDLCAGSLVISQVYPGGGNVGATYNSDFVELHNRGTTDISLAGRSLQYATATGTTWADKVNLSGTVPAGGYFLVQLSSGTNGAPLPVTPDQTSGSINLSGTAGKLALVNSTTSLLMGTSCPTANPLVLDFVGYGTTADCREGTTNASSVNTTQSLARFTNGCADVNDNAGDLEVVSVAPRNAASTARSPLPSRSS